MRGEQSLPPYNGKIGIGSPPLARGTDQKLVDALSAEGITPACAGNRKGGTVSETQKRDHPRLRGEQSGTLCRSCAGRGSPPLARGTGTNQRLHSNHHGITPACAGNSGLSCGSCLRGWDHPRLRGEQPCKSIGILLVTGSPPLARGTVIVAKGETQRSRITPACAGNSSHSP